MDDNSSYEKIFKNNRQLEGIIKKSAVNDVRVQLISRVDTNVVNGIVRAVKELVANTIIIGWSGKALNEDDIRARSLEKLLNYTHTTVLASKLITPLSLTDKIIATFPKNSELEIGFERSVATISQLAANTKSSLLVIAPLITLESFRKILKVNKTSIQVSYLSYTDPNDCCTIADTAKENDMFLFVNARNKSISCDLVYENIVHQLVKKHNTKNIIMMYPEQNPVAEPDTASNLDVLEASIIMENLARLNKISKIFKK